MATSGGSGWRRLTVAALAVVGATTVAGVMAQGGDRSAVPPDVLQRRTTATTTTTITTTTDTGSQPTTEPTDRERADGAQILTVLEGYLGFEFDERSRGYGPSQERIERFTAGVLRDRSLETLQTRRDLGAFLQGRVLVRVEWSKVAGDTAEMLVCYRDTTAAYLGDGSPLGGASSPAMLVGLSFRRSASGWAVVERYAGDRIPCDL